MTKIPFRALLLDISLKFFGEEREILLNAANSGDTERIKAALHEAEETLTGRFDHGRTERN